MKTKWIVFGILAILFLAYVFIRKDNLINNKEDIGLIQQHLGIDGKLVSSERIWLDKEYRNWYMVFFIAKGRDIKIEMDDVKNYYSNDPSEPNPEKAAISSNLEHSGKYLRKLKWGPLVAYRDLPQRTGVWNKHNAVYIAIGDDAIYGYFENYYDMGPQPGPW